VVADPFVHSFVRIQCRSVSNYISCVDAADRIFLEMSSVGRVVDGVDEEKRRTGRLDNRIV